ncbi:MAG: hypothetical protein U0175_09905 [Caldilineaceae bacterium]
MLVLVALTVTILSVWPVSAAVELNYFSVVPSSSAVLIEWNTAKEYNLIAFQVLCKKASELDTAYHPIVTKSAKGSPTEGMSYDHLVTSGLTPGVPYCFRLREITKNGEPGQIFDRCGYGLSITPTPTLEGRFLAETATADVFARATEAAAALVQPTIDPLILTLTPQPPISLLGTPVYVATQQAIFAQQTLQAIAVATVQQQIFEATATVQQQSIDGTATASALGIPATQTAIALTPTFDPNAPTLDPNAPTPTVVQSGAENGTPQAMLPNGTDINAASASQQPVDNTNLSPELAAQQTAQAEQILAAQATQTMMAMLATPAQQTESPLPTPPVQDGGANAGAPTYPYEVVTAAPTPIPPTVPATLTPLPTSVPTVAAQVNDVLVASPQNIMIGMLAVVFIGASGIGVLGMLSGVLYLRSRSRRRSRYDY